MVISGYYYIAIISIRPHLPPANPHNSPLYHRAIINLIHFQFAITSRWGLTTMPSSYWLLTRDSLSLTIGS